MIGLTLALNSFFITGFTFHIVSIFGNQGYSKTEAIAVFIPIAIIAIATSTLGNILSDYIQHKIFVFIMQTSAVLGAVGLLFLSYKTGVYLVIAGLGIFGGLYAVVHAVTWPRYYGRKHLGAITGKVTSFFVVASAIAPSLFSFCFVNLGSYSFVSYFMLAYTCFLIVGSLNVRNPQ